MNIDYSRNPETGIFALEEGLADLGRVRDVPWLIGQIESFDRGEILERFKPWPELVGPEGVWGHMIVSPYAVMCQMYVPPQRRRELGEVSILKIDRASTPDQILRRLRELG